MEKDERGVAMKPLPIGRDNFKQIIENNCYYVDKTKLIEDLLNTSAYVTLFTRPRRFGKSLMLMVRKVFTLIICLVCWLSF